jgi:hypothetical protein
MLHSKLALMYLFYFILLCLLVLFIFIVPTLSLSCDQELHQSSRIVSIVITCLQDRGFRQLWNYCQCCGHAFWSEEAFLSSVLSNCVLWRTTNNWNMMCTEWIFLSWCDDLSGRCYLKDWQLLHEVSGSSGEVGWLGRYRAGIVNNICGPANVSVELSIKCNILQMISYLSRKVTK